MTIEEIRNKKTELEDRIIGLIQKFDEETSLKVKDLEIETTIVKGYAEDVIQYRNVIAKVEI